MEIYLSPAGQEAIFSAQRVFFIITCVLNALSLFCLLKETPPNQAPIRAYLLFIQVIVTISNVYLDVLFQHVPVFPAIAGYCVGLLCRAGMSPHAVHAGFILITWLVGAAIMFCIFFRHQTIIPDDSPLKIGDKTRWAIQCCTIILLTTVAIIYAAYPFDQADFARILSQNRFNVSWIANRGNFYAHERTSPVITGIWMMDSQVLLSWATVASLFFHMFHVLRTVTTRSRASVKCIRRSLILLFIQIAVPLAMLVIPVFILFTSIACECIPFSVTLPANCVTSLHPLTHSLILLLITPAYRRFIISSIMWIPNKLMNK